MKVCQCEAVGSDAIQAAISAGAATVDQVTDGCRAGGGCGRCWAIIEDMIAKTHPTPIAA